MKTCWNILIWMWMGVIHRAEHVNGDFLLTSSPLIPTDGDLFTLTCSFRDEFTVNIGWLQNNKPKVVTQRVTNCIKSSLAYGQDTINRINVSCSTTAHSMTFRFSSTTDQGSVWQCGKQVSDYVIHPRSNNYTIGSVMSTQSLPTTTRSMAISPDPETVTPTKVVTRPVTSTQSTSTTTRYMETTSDPETVTPKTVVTRPVTSTQSTSTTTRYMETTSDPETVTPKKGPKNPQPLNTECNVTGVIAGSTIGTLLLTLVIEGLVLTVLYRKGFRFGNVLKAPEILKLKKWTTKDIHPWIKSVVLLMTQE
ncbi:mucin-5AC-like isoform X3 [Haliotis rufescens]|uniref:mucin-5AC-like isoform X3 n=1 Tax=Haliotis rufescens TaxID=6454 RepID=UPI00201F040C|nr:mucin-5AC-like isoform X3 [Haliotis rufescens]